MHQSPPGRVCVICGILVGDRASRVLTCSKMCTLTWLHASMRLVSHVQTGEPFIIGLSREEARELSFAAELVDDNRFRSLHRKYLAAVAMGGAEVQAFIERSRLTDDEFH